MNNYDKSIEKLYNNLLKIKNKKIKTEYPYSILNDTNTVIFTKKQIDLFYIKHFEKCNLIKKGGNNNQQCIIYYF